MLIVPPIYYAVIFVAGIAGFLMMFFMGAVHAHHGHHGHGRAHGGRGHGRGPTHAPRGHAHGARGHGKGSVDATGDASDADGDGDGAPLGALQWVIPFLSPLNWFSWMLGAGAAGMLAQLAHLRDPQRLAVAIGGAVIFKVAVVGPIWDTIFQFASRPAGNLESCLMQTAEAVVSFNERGEGLVRLNIDGRSEDVLARLTMEERAKGARVRKGERLLVEEVDPATNSCRVSRA